MGFCILGGKEGYLRKSLSDKLTSLGQTVGIGAAVADFTNAIQNIYTSRYTAGQDSLKVDRKLTLTSSQTGNNINIADNWYTTCDASAVYTAGQNSVKTSRKLTLSASQTGSNVDIADNWYTTCDASAVYKAGQTNGKTTACTYITTWVHNGVTPFTYTTTQAEKVLIIITHRPAAQGTWTCTNGGTGSTHYDTEVWYGSGSNAIEMFIGFNLAKGATITATNDNQSFHIYRLT